MTRKKVSEISLLSALLGIFTGGAVSFNRPIIEVFLFAIISGIIFFVISYIIISFIYSSDLGKENLKENDEIRIMQNELSRLREIKQKAVEKRTGVRSENVKEPKNAVKGTKIDIKAGEEDDIRGGL